MRYSIRIGSYLTANPLANRKKLANDKHSSLLYPAVSDEEKKSFFKKTLCGDIMKPHLLLVIGALLE
jgi:hypothetical protein